MVTALLKNVSLEENLGLVHLNAFFERRKRNVFIISRPSISSKSHIVLGICNDGERADGFPFFLNLNVVLILYFMGFVFGSN